MDKLNTDLIRIELEMERNFHSVRQEINSVRDEVGSLRSEVGSLRQEVGSVKVRMAELNQSMNYQFNQLNDKIEIILRTITGIGAEEERDEN
jgi:DNA anti-recombination protein RmuC